MTQLILGGARSGKSALAERLASQTKMPVTYIATATADDEEMRQRISHHQQQRPRSWQTVECPYDLSDTLRSRAKPDQCILVDCLTLWLSNLLCAKHDTLAARQTLLKTITELPGELIMVSNEVGLGITPMGELSRRFVDESGRLHQALAQHCERVIFTAAGLPLVMKGATL